MYNNLSARRVRLACLLFVVWSAASCGGRPSSTPPVQQYQSLQIAPISATVRQGATVGLSGNRFVAVGRRIDGSADFSWNSLAQVAAVSWHSSAPAVATIDAEGRFVTMSSGTTTISSTLGDLTASTTLVVSDTAPLLTAVEMAPGLPEFGKDGTITGIHFQATAKYDDGSEHDITREGLWVSGDITAASVDSSGLVTFKSNASCEVLFLYGLSYNRFTITHAGA